MLKSYVYVNKCGRDIKIYGDKFQVNYGEVIWEI